MTDDLVLTGQPEQAEVVDVTRADWIELVHLLINSEPGGELFVVPVHPDDPERVSIVALGDLPERRWVALEDHWPGAARALAEACRDRLPVDRMGWPASTRDLPVPWPHAGMKCVHGRHGCPFCHWPEGAA